MKKKTAVLVSALALVLALGTSTFADNVGYIDMEKLFSNFNEAKKAQAELQKKREDYQKTFEDKQKGLEKARKDKKSDEDIQKLINKIEDELKPKQEDILRNEADVQKRLLGKVTEVTKVVAKQYNIDVVVDKRAIYFGGFDLTEFLLEKLNK